MLNTHGRFGCEDKRELPCTIGLNEKGGISDEEFERYVNTSLNILFPDLEDMPGKRILLKDDSGPGRNGRDLLNKCWFRGIFIYPGLPNASSMQQETDINYGPFKGVIRRNLAKIATTCYAEGITMSLGTSTFGLIVYGGVCPDSGVRLENALESTFDNASNTHSWSEGGVVPFTKKCLTNKKVHHDGTDKDNLNFDVYQDIQSQNDFSTTQLSVMGYKGDALNAQFREDKIRERQATATVTVPQTRERQEAIAATNTHGKKIFVTGGKHVTSDDMFKAAEINRQTAEAAEREKDKKGRVNYHRRRKATTHPRSPGE